MNKWLEILIGLVLIIAAVYICLKNIWTFGTAALVFFKGGIIWLAVLIGLLFLMLGISDLKE